MTRNDDAVVVLRLSIDEFHFTSPSLSFDHYNNIINVFRNKYKDNKKFILRVHTMQNDSTLENVISKMGGVLEYDKINGITDNNEVIKIVPQKAHIKFNDGYEIFVGLSKLFLADIKADLREWDSDNIRRALDIFEKDMKVSEYGNPSVITNCNGLQGLDFWSDYNGNITIWGCQQPNDLHSVYSSSFKEIVDDTYSNIQSYSFLDKGYYYRRNIIKDINPRAVLRSEVMNLRDYAGAFIIEENHTQLYYGIRVIKDYLDEGILRKEDISTLPKELLDLICSNVEGINDQYRSSNYDIYKQYMLNHDKYSKEDWEDLFILTRLGHYDVRECK